MALSNTATPVYYGRFRESVMRGEIPVNKEIRMEMDRIEDLIRNPGVYYDDQAVEGFIRYCENELTLTDGGPLELLDSFKLWAEQIFGWYYYVERSVFVPGENGRAGHYVRTRKKKRLVNKQYLIVARGAAKSMYASCLQSYFLNVDTTTTHQITTAPTMKQAEEVLSPIRTSITRARGPLFQFLTEGSLQNTTGSKINRQKLASTKKGIENFLTGSFLEVRPMRGKRSSMPHPKTRPDSPVLTLQGSWERSLKWRGTLRFLPQLEMRPSSNAPNPVESREAPPTSSFPDFSEPP